MADIAIAGLVELGLTDYRATYDMQVALVDKRKKAGGDFFLVTEHPSVFTLGRRGGRENLIVSEQFLLEKGVSVVQIERGGDITYHGEGQLVLYPILHLRQAGLTVTEYVHLLEELMIRLAADFGVVAARDSRNHGVWVGDKKLGSVGIAIRHGISFHGLALNVNLSLEPFTWVNPCGLTGVQMTTISRQCRKEVTLPMVKENLHSHLSELFDCEFIDYQKDQLDVAMCK